VWVFSFDATFDLIGIRTGESGCGRAAFALGSLHSLLGTCVSLWEGLSASVDSAAVLSYLFPNGHNSASFRHSCGCTYIPSSIWPWALLQCSEYSSSQEQALALCRFAHGSSL